MIGEILGHYRIESQLGEGGMGIVYRAHDIHLDRPVAIKVLSGEGISNPERKKRFVQEARTASALNHPNIVHVYDIGEWNGMDYIAMEYVSGKTWGEIAKAGPIGIQDLVTWAGQAADALAAAHRAGIIHRDIKPANIMVTESGLVKILDFGLAKLTEMPGNDDGTGETRTMQVDNGPRTEIGKVVGTVAYMSPEQAEGKRLDARSDMFSFGSALYEMATGHRAFRGDSSIATLSAILTKDPEPISALRDAAPPELDDIVARCLRKQPGARYSGMSEVKAALEDIRDEMRSSSPSVRGLRVTAGRRASRRTRLMAGSAIACLTVLGFFVRQRFFAHPVQQLVTILPFRSQGDPVDPALAEGLAAVIARNLSLFEQSGNSVRFAAATSEAAENPASARKALGVTLVVTGTIKRTRDKMRWKTVLIDARTLKPTSEASAEFPANDLLGLQRESARRVAALIGVGAPPRVRELLDRGGTTVPVAYESYVRANGFLQHATQAPDVEQAIVLFRKAIEADSSYGLAHAGLGEAYWAKSVLTRDKTFAEDGRRNCIQAIANKADLPHVHLTLGKILAGTGRAQEAVVEFQRTIDTDPLNTEAYGKLGAAYQTLGRMEDAETAYRKAVELRPDYFAPYMQAAAFYVNRGRYKDAETMYRKVIGLVPENSTGFRNLAAVYHFLGRSDDAVAMLKKSLAIKPSPGAYANLGTVYWFQGRYSDAIPLMEKAFEMEPNNYLFAGNLAEAYWWVSEYKDKAADVYRRAIELADQQLAVNPGDPNIHGNLGSYYAKLQEPSKALKHIAQARRLAPMDPKVLIKSAFVYAVTGKTEQALGALDLALQAGYSIFEIRRAPDLAELRKDPRYQDLEQRALAAASKDLK